MYTYNHHWKIIHYKGWYSTINKICIKLIVVFLEKCQNTCDPFNFVISNKYDLLWYPSCKYPLQFGVYKHCNWTNIEFDYWTRCSTKRVMCHHLTTLTNLFLLLNVWPTTNLDSPVIYLWLSTQSCNQVSNVPSFNNINQFIFTIKCMINHQFRLS